MNATDQLLANASLTFKHLTGQNPEIAVFAPGRVNLIGEHVDYNEGYVLPFALPFKTVIVGSRSVRKESRILSCTMTTNVEPISFTISGELTKGEPSWANYVKGTVFQYLQDLPTGFAFDAVIDSNVPLGSGLSSSAALEVATATFLEKVAGITNVTGVTKALRCQRAEHTFADTPCGIMDQYISAMGEEDNMLLIDCRTNTFKLVPFGRCTDDRPVMLVTNSNVHHNLSSSEYPVRVSQCNNAVTEIRTKFPQIASLRDVTLPMLSEITNMSEILFKRAKHCITENERTLATAKALVSGDYLSVGQLMTQSHESLRDDYEVSCAELDTLVDLALQVPGVLGSRMTGGGFGGCTITLVRKDAVRNLEKHLKQKYLEKTGKECTCYEVSPSDGASQIELRRCNKKKSFLSGSSVTWATPIVIAGVAIIVGLILLRR